MYLVNSHARRFTMESGLPVGLLMIRSAEITHETHVLQLYKNNSEPSFPHYFSFNLQNLLT